MKQLFTNPIINVAMIKVTVTPIRMGNNLKDYIVGKEKTVKLFGLTVYKRIFTDSRFV